MRFLLYKVGNLNMLQDLEDVGDVAEFPICNVSWRDAGSYRCRYSTKSDPPMWSEPSDPVEPVVAETYYPKPSISLLSSGGVSPGGAVTVQRWGRHQNMRFLLYKDGNWNVLQDVEPDADVDEFPIRNVSWRDAGSYSCQYSTKSDPPVWLEPRDIEELLVAIDGNVEEDCGHDTSLTYFCFDFKTELTAYYTRGNIVLVLTLA
ncbi:immunoglobulin superfamily member 1-like [Chrysemys picta bellii]|uniref:immunoglobulin superfamily member 1-like n=1 Tax=Chrysemys picta bellii TaxID=8478 RepID=UPI0032B28E67